MIKLFRNIRKNLLNEGKTTKYFKYAVGEIVLVVIGILIALQINNWNQLNRTKIEEKELLVLVKNAIKDDLKDLEDATSFVKKEITYTDRILYYLEYESSYPDSLWSDFRILTIDIGNRISFNQVAIKSFEAKEELIRNDSLRYQIIKLYDESYSKVNSEVENYRSNLVGITRPLTKARFILPLQAKIDDNNQSITYPMQPVNFEALEIDLEFTNAVKTIRSNQVEHQRTCMLTMKEIEKVYKSIVEELN
jgi:hypothetical protein